IPDIESAIPSRRSFGERAAINSVVQGSAADLIKLAMVELQSGIKGSTDHGINGSNLDPKIPRSHDPSAPTMLLQIHDELVFECPRDHAEPVATEIRRIMENAMTLTVPLKVDVGWAESWFDGK
ncbi:MAG: hypothetical protein K2Q20_08630, partial [Phycisphaerales bacterium]|nr:hypothetical protein [Phycisphaerales bacterium]